MLFSKQTAKKGRFWTPKDKRGVVILVLAALLLLSPVFLFGYFVHGMGRSAQRQAMAAWFLEQTDSVWQAREQELYLVVPQFFTPYVRYQEESRWQVSSFDNHYTNYFSAYLGDQALEGHLELDLEDPATELTFTPDDGPPITFTRLPEDASLPFDIAKIGD